DQTESSARPQGAPGFRPVYRSQGGRRGSGLFAQALRQAQLAFDRCDTSLHRGDRRCGAQASHRAPATAGGVMALWLADKPLVLASKSAPRRALLEAAGIPVEVRPADID